MQTFVPYADFAASAAVLDDLRLGKQRVETLQILRALVYPTYRGWKNHPATRMWRGFTPALVAYGLAVCREWERRGRADAVAAALREFTGGGEPDVETLRRRGQLPPWLGLSALHVSHRSALVRKLPGHYRPYFPDVPDDLPYVWPAPVFPRWPVRRSAGAAMDFATALTELGLGAARAGQREAVEQLCHGDDVTLHWPAGAGASTVGLLAALCRPGPTWWLTDHAGETDSSSPPLSQLQPAPRPTAGASKVSPSIARPPTEEDLAAVWREAAGHEFHFHRPSALASAAVRAVLPEPSLIVLDGVTTRRRLPPAPRLRIVSDVSR